VALGPLSCLFVHFQLHFQTNCSCRIVF
jgi:hypothetical protein